MKPRFYVISRDLAQFREWAKGRGLELQACKQLCAPVDFMGLDFTSPTREFVLLSGYREGRDDFTLSLFDTAIARYCRDRRIVGGIKETTL